MNKSKLRMITLTALTVAICVIGSFIKVPGFITTAALDSAPAFLSVLFLPPAFSGVAGAWDILLLLSLRVFHLVHFT